MLPRAQKTLFVCQQCGHDSQKWLGKCPSCGGWNTFVEEVVRPEKRSPSRAPSGGYAEPKRLSEIASSSSQRLLTGIGELDRVLGGGIVPGSLILIGGDPGIGKSTLTLQLGEQVARQGAVTLYVSGEESLEQTKLRAGRLGASSENLYVLAETDLEAVKENVQRLSPRALIVDSIQTMFRPDLASSPGSVGQVRECGAELLRMAKSKGVATFLVGHVTKDGTLAGPRTLEHIVDTVLYFEGDRHQAYRILRAVKNRFGATDEIGVFEMTGEGLRGVENPSQVFLSERSAEQSGSAVVCALEGTRPLLVEVQALVAPANYGVPQRVANGVDHRRLSMLLAVLERRAGISLGMQDVFVNAVGGVRLEDPGVDLGILAAVASSSKDKPIHKGAVAIGEVGLGGEVRPASQTEGRLKEARKLGFTVCVMADSKRADPVPKGLQVILVRDIRQALSALF